MLIYFSAYVILIILLSNSSCRPLLSICLSIILLIRSLFYNTAFPIICISAIITSKRDIEIILIMITLFDVSWNSWLLLLND